MRVKCYNIFKYEELSDKAKEKARDWYRNASSSDQWWESTYEDAENVGIKITSFDIDRGNNITGKFNEVPLYVARQIIKDHGDICETHKTAKAYLASLESLPKDEDGDCDREQAEELEKEFLRSILEDYLIMLRKEYEIRDSDEYVTESILANEYEFDENGNRDS